LATQGWPDVRRQLLCIAAAFGIFSQATATQTPDMAQVYQLARFANAAYETTTEIKQVCRDNGYHLIHTGRVLNGTLRFFIAENRHTRSTLIAVRGTDNLGNTITDLDAKLIENDHIPIRSHQGFTEAADAVYAAIAGRLNKSYFVSTVGHSLGGAVAVLLSMYLDHEGFKIQRVTTFGQPKLSDRKASNRFAHLPILRLVTEKDIVPLVPPVDLSQAMQWELDIFWHLGDEILLLPGPYYTQVTGLDGILRSIDLIKEKPGKTNINAHRMEQYLLNLRQKVQSSVEVPFSQRKSPQPGKQNPSQKNLPQSTLPPESWI